jgi:ribosomal protein RSM22 (predicted rRNA methylase)
VNLPPTIAASVERWLQDNGGVDLRENTGRLTGTYKSGGTSARVDLAAYLATRTPATFAAVGKALAEAARAAPDVSPSDVLDVGSGAGSATWAATSRWPGIASVTMLDNDPRFLRLAEELSTKALPATTRARYLLGDVGAALSQADLVIASYVIAERPVAEAAQLAKSLWSATKSMLLIVEPGTPSGFERLLAMRKALLSSGAHIAAPCTHTKACPMQGGDWCHFTVRLQRSRLHRHAKSAEVPWEDEPFAYLAAVRDAPIAARGRILRPPRINKIEASFALCTHEGLQNLSVPKRNKDLFKRLRKLDWGDIIPEENQ